ncbi:MAG: M55 family metallopeptidase [Pseudomonadota bacterium]
MTGPVKRVLIIADIEGSSGCWSYEASRFLTKPWAEACARMSLDAAAVATALFEAGAEKVIVKDFHRTAYNLLPELIDPRAKVVHGYRAGPVPGLGDPEDAQGVMFLGLHAASGTEGFLAHTLTSRISSLEVDGRPLAEVELFSAALAGHGIRPLFFSGCEKACLQARERLPGLAVLPLDKSGGPDRVDLKAWRQSLALAAAQALRNDAAPPYSPPGPFRARMVMRDGPKAARKIARRWGLEAQGDAIVVEAPDQRALFVELARLVYLTPFLNRILPVSLFCYRILGKIGLAWAGAQLRKGCPDV